MRQIYITTTDNPFNALSEFDDWYEWDISHDYWTCDILQDALKYMSIAVTEKMSAVGSQALTHFMHRCYDVYHNHAERDSIITAMYLMILAEHHDKRLPKNVRYKIVFKD